MPDNSTAKTQEFIVIAYTNKKVHFNEVMDDRDGLPTLLSTMDYVSTKAAKICISRMRQFDGMMLILYSFEDDIVHIRWQEIIRDEIKSKWLKLGKLEVLQMILDNLNHQIHIDNVRRRIC